jgi:hypothetical protein
MSAQTRCESMAANSTVAGGRAAPLMSYFYLSISLLIAGVVIYGFGQTVEPKLIRATPARPVLLYIHGSVFFGWVLFFIFQSVLVRAGQTRWHRWAGWFGAGLGGAMFVLGVSTAIAMARFNKMVLHTRYPQGNLLISFFDITAFAAPLSLAIYWRNKRECHRRLQLMASSALTAAAFGRFLPFWLRPGTRHSVAAFAFVSWTVLYAGVDALILLGVARDLVVDRKIHAVYMYGLPAFIVCQSFVVYTIWHHSGWWLKIASIFLN